VVSPNPGLLAAFVRTGNLSGILRWKVNLGADVVEIEAGQCGWRGLWIDTSAASDVEAVLTRFADQLNFPEYFDKTPTALGAFLGDVLGGEVKGFIVWSGWQELVRQDAVQAGVIAEVLDRVGLEHGCPIFVIDSSGDFPEIAELAQM